MSSLKTNNSHLEAKITLRLNHLPEGNPLYVLDAFCGEGLIWREVVRRSGRDIRILSIDHDQGTAADIVCDNLKVLSGLNLDKYDVIDLDAYGCPFAQMQILFNHKYNGTVFVTYIQTMYGRLPNGILRQAGYTTAMLSKAQTLFSKRPIEVLESYLANHNILSYTIKSLDRKHYLCFNVKNL